jgi:hypothetical protein
MFPTCKNSQKWVKNQKSIYKHYSFDGLIQEYIDLSDIYLAVTLKETPKFLQNLLKNHNFSVNFCFKFSDLYAMQYVDFFLLIEINYF